MNTQSDILMRGAQCLAVRGSSGCNLSTISGPYNHMKGGRNVM